MSAGAVEVHGARERSRRRPVGSSPFVAPGGLPSASPGAYLEEDGRWFSSVRERGIPGAGDAARLRPGGAGRRHLGGDRTALPLQRLVAAGHQYRDHRGDVPDGLPHPVHPEPGRHRAAPQAGRAHPEHPRGPEHLRRAGERLGRRAQGIPGRVPEAPGRGTEQTEAAITARERRLGSRGARAELPGRSLGAHRIGHAACHAAAAVAPSVQDGGRTMATTDAISGRSTPGLGALHDHAPRRLVLHVRAHLAPRGGGGQPGLDPRSPGGGALGDGAPAAPAPLGHRRARSVDPRAERAAPPLREGTLWNERVVGALVLLLGLVGGGQLPAQDT